MAWKGDSRRHSLSRKGIKTNIDEGRRFDVSNYVARGESIEDAINRAEVKILDDPLFKESLKDVRKSAKEIERRLIIRLSQITKKSEKEIHEDWELDEFVRRIITESYDDAMGVQRFGEEEPPLYNYLTDHVGLTDEEMVDAKFFKTSGKIKFIGSQAREKIEDTDEGYKFISKKGKEVLLYDPSADNYELWFMNDDFAGYVIEINGKGYEFAHSVPKDEIKRFGDE